MLSFLLLKSVTTNSYLISLFSIFLHSYSRFFIFLHFLHFLEIVYLPSIITFSLLFFITILSPSTLSPYSTTLPFNGLQVTILIFCEGRDAFMEIHYPDENTSPMLLPTFISPRILPISVQKLFKVFYIFFLPLLVFLKSR